MHMKTCRWVLLCALVITCLCGCLFLDIWNLFFSTYDFHIDITVADLSGTHAWDNEVAGTLEYSWGFLIDWDANATTGDGDGFDVIVWVAHESDGPPSAEGQLVEELNSAGLNSVFRAEYGEWILGGWGFFSPPTPACSAAGNTVSISFRVSYERGDPAADFRTRFFASHDPLGGPEASDETSIVTGSASTTDASGDAGGYDFIDIVSAQISYIP
jgi:hypothetical protein